MYRLLFIGLLCWLWLSIDLSLAQSKRIDSLRAVLTKHPQLDTFRVNRLNELAEMFIAERTPNDSMASAALNLAQQIHYRYGQVQALFELTTGTAFRREVDAGKRFANRALQLTQLMDDKKLLLEAYLNWDNAYITSVYQQQIVDNLNRSRVLAKQLKDDKSLLSLEVITEAWYNNQGNYPAGLQHALARLAISQKQIIPIKSRIQALAAVAITYSYIKDYEQAIFYMRRAVNFANAEAKRGVIKEFDKLSIVHELGYLYLQMKRYADAESCFVQVLKGKSIPPYFKQYILMLLASAYAGEGK